MICHGPLNPQNKRSEKNIPPHEKMLSLGAMSNCVMTCNSTCDLTCDSVSASSCQRKGMRCHDDASTESQVKSQVKTALESAQIRRMSSSFPGLCLLLSDRLLFVPVHLVVLFLLFRKTIRKLRLIRVDVVAKLLAQLKKKGL
jgi:hypothetical protein